MLTDAGIAELEHLPQDGPGAAAAGAAEGGQRPQRGAHGLGVGVVRVVDDRDAVRAVGALHPEAAGGPEPVETTGDLGRVHAGGVGGRGGGQHVVHVVQAGQSGGDRVPQGGLIRPDLQVEDGALLVVGAHVPCGDEA